MRSNLTKKNFISKSLINKTLHIKLTKKFKKVFEKYGITFHFVGMQDVTNIEAAITPNTKLIWVETPTNPMMKVSDLRALSTLAHEHDMTVFCDNTFATPIFQRPLELGCDVVVHSTTKYIGGHGTTVAGIVVDSGKFDWKASADKFPMMNQPDPSYHGVVYTEALGEAAFIGRCRSPSTRVMPNRCRVRFASWSRRPHGSPMRWSGRRVGRG